MTIVKVWVNFEFIINLFDSLALGLLDRTQEVEFISSTSATKLTAFV